MPPQTPLSSSRILAPSATRKHQTSPQPHVDAPFNSHGCFRCKWPRVHSDAHATVDWICNSLESRGTTKAEQPATCFKLKHKQALVCRNPACIVHTSVTTEQCHDAGDHHHATYECKPFLGNTNHPRCCCNMTRPTSPLDCCSLSS